MTVGGVLGEALDLYRRFFTRFFLVAATVFVVIDLLSAIAADAQGESDALGLFWGLVAVAAGLVGSFWVQGALVAAVQDVRDGRADDEIGELYRRVRPVLGTLILGGLLAGLGILGGLILLVIPGIFLLTRWAVVAPVIVIERLPATDALRRSWELVRGNGWKMFGVIISTLVIALVAHGVFVGIFLFLPDFLANWLGGLVADSLVTPFVALAWTVAYYRLRGEPVAAPVPEAA